MSTDLNSEIHLTSPPISVDRRSEETSIIISSSDGSSSDHEDDRRNGGESSTIIPADDGHPDSESVIRLSSPVLDNHSPAASDSPTPTGINDAFLLSLILIALGTMVGIVGLLDQDWIHSNSFVSPTITYGLYKTCPADRSECTLTTNYCTSEPSSNATSFLIHHCSALRTSQGFCAIGAILALIAYNFALFDAFIAMTASRSIPCFSMKNRLSVSRYLCIASCIAESIGVIIFSSDIKNDGVSQYQWGRGFTTSIICISMRVLSIIPSKMSQMPRFITRRFVRKPEELAEIHRRINQRNAQQNEPLIPEPIDDQPFVSRPSRCSRLTTDMSFGLALCFLLIGLNLPDSLILTPDSTQIGLFTSCDYRGCRDSTSFCSSDKQSSMLFVTPINSCSSFRVSQALCVIATIFISMAIIFNWIVTAVTSGRISSFAVLKDRYSFPLLIGSFSIISGSIGLIFLHSTIDSDYYQVQLGPAFILMIVALIVVFLGIIFTKLFELPHLRRSQINDEPAHTRCYECCQTLIACLECFRCIGECVGAAR